MKKSLTPAARSYLAAALLIVPVAAELVVAAVGDHLTGLLVFAAAQLAAWLLLATVCLRLLAACQPSARPGRVGARMVLAGCVSQMLFAAQYAAAAIGANGDPEIPFALFLLGFLLMTVGGLLWGTSLRRAGLVRAGWGLQAVAVLGFLAMAVGDNLFHDVFLLASYASWVAVGAGTPVSAAPRSAPESSPRRQPRTRSRPAVVKARDAGIRRMP